MVVMMVRVTFVMVENAVVDGNDCSRGDAAECREGVVVMLGMAVVMVVLREVLSVLAGLLVKVRW